MTEQKKSVGPFFYNQLDLSPRNCPWCKGAECSFSRRCRTRKVTEAFYKAATSVVSYTLFRQDSDSNEATSTHQHYESLLESARLTGEALRNPALTPAKREKALESLEAVTAGLQAMLTKINLLNQSVYYRLRNRMIGHPIPEDSPKDTPKDSSSPATGAKP